MVVVDNDSTRFLRLLKLFILTQCLQAIVLAWTVVSTYSFVHVIFPHKRVEGGVKINGAILETIQTQVYQQDPVNVLVLMMVMIILEAFNTTVSSAGFIKQSVFLITTSFIVNCWLVLLNLINTLNSADLLLNIALIVVSFLGSIVTFNLRKEMTRVECERRGEVTSKLIGKFLIS